MPPKRVSLTLPPGQPGVPKFEPELTAERNAQLDSVLRVIEESIEKLKISLILPRVFENPITLREYLSDTAYESCVEGLEVYLREKRAEHHNMPPHLNFELVKLIDLFHENYKMIRFLPDWYDDLSKDDKALLESFRLLHNIAEQRLRKSAVSELNKEKKLHHIFHENERMKKNIADFQQKLRNQKINLRWKLAAKDGVIHKYEEDLAFKKWDNQMRIKQEIIKSNRSIRNIHTTSSWRQRDLEEELDRANQAYEKIVKQNLIHEEEARDEKGKLLIQLQALLKKYDQTIGDKRKENIDLQKEYEREKADFDIFMIEYQREEEEYDRIIIQRELEDAKRQEEKVMLFMMHRAARVIQRYWRRYRREQKKAAKGKGKGGRGSKAKKK